MSRQGDYLVWYAKVEEQLKYRQLYVPKGIGDDGSSEYKWLRMPDGTNSDDVSDELAGLSKVPEGAKSFPIWSSNFERRTVGTDAL